VMRMCVDQQNHKNRARYDWTGPTHYAVRRRGRKAADDTRLTRVAG